MIPSSKTKKMFMPEHNNNENTVRRCRYPGCGSEGHNRSTCAMRYRQEEEVACERMIPRVHADNKEELKRIRAMTAARKLEERMLNQARVLQEGAVRAQERAQARQDRDRQALERQVQVRQAQEGEAFGRGLVLLEAEQRLEAALEGAARFNAGAWEAREVELARQERDRIAFREREARAAQNVMQGWDEERQEEERHIQGLPEERQAELRQGWEEERQAELREVELRQVRDMQIPPNMDEIPLADRWRVWRDYENHGAPPNMVTDNELARMVALPVLRETAVEATECPICIEDLGEVGKTVLKCGHTLCVSCFLQQMMRATAESRARECKCPVCRVSYIM